MKKFLTLAGCLATVLVLDSCTADELQTPQAKKSTATQEASFMKDGDENPPVLPPTGDGDRDKTKT